MKRKSNAGPATTLDCPDSIKAVLSSLQIPVDMIVARSLPHQPEATGLVVAQIDETGREYHLTPAAAAAWHAMRAAADQDGVVLRIVSAFRTVERQVEIVRAKLADGLALDRILCTSAPPGFSEHHTGRAIDLATDSEQPLEEEFELTSAFRWLCLNAGRFGYSLSFPRDNRYGYAYEPWHWCFRAGE
jgi:zinc D-Ala-D-Ala carboxypeptidase